MEEKGKDFLVIVQKKGREKGKTDFTTETRGHGERELRLPMA
jgi:hypothetical protein